MNSYACAGCAALNSKWHRAKQEGAECRQRLDETMEESLVTAARVKQLEEEMEGMRDAPSSGVAHPLGCSRA